MAPGAIPLLGGKSIHCVNERQMTEALRLANEDAQASAKIQAALTELEADLSRNERAALAFVIIHRLKETAMD